MSPDTNLFGGDRRTGQQGVLRSYQPQRTNVGAGVGLARKEGASLGAEVSSQSSQLHAETLFHSLWLLFPMLSLQTAKEEVILSPDEIPPCAWDLYFTTLQCVLFLP